jgi:outer membrane biosynthesis protein TonB
LVPHGEPQRLSSALVLSLIIHALLLSITLGGQTFGLPGLKFPWNERRSAVSDLRVTLMPAQPIAPMPAPPSRPPEVTSVTMSPPVLARSEKPIATAPPPPAAQAAEAAPAPVPVPAPPAPEPVAITRKRPDVNLPVVAEAPPTKASSDSVARITAIPASEPPIPSDADGAAQKAAEQARLEQEKQTAEKLRQDAVRAEQAAKTEAARIEAERKELARQEDLRRESLQQERAKLDEKIRQEAAKQELERAETARQDAIKQEAARQEAAKQEAARQERAKQELAQREKADEEAKREERLRAIGKQLAEEAAQRDAAAKNPSRSLLPSASSLRRGWLYGRADPNADLVLYAEAISRKIETNMTFDTVRDVVKQAHVRPLVSVAVRADGTIEKVTFVVSSGVPAIDEAIRKVVASQAPYGAFPPSLARQYDVIEIRRTWVFDTAIHLQ